MSSAILSVAICLVLYSVVTTLICRFRAPRSPVRTMLFLAVLIAPLSIPFRNLLTVDFSALDSLLPLKWQAGITCLILFTMFFYIVLQGYSVVLSSITTRILVLFENAPEQKLSLDDLLREFALDELMAKKLRYMVRDGLLVEKSSAGATWLEPTAKGAAMGKFFFHTKKFLNWGDGG